jgi:hypothetical protein
MSERTVGSFPAALSGVPADQSGPITQSRAMYLPDSGSCAPGKATLDQPSLTITTRARTSADSNALRSQFTDEANQAVDDPSSVDLQRTGPVTVVVDGQAATAYVVPLGDDQEQAFVDSGNASVMLSGAFSKAEVPFLVGRLQT